MQEITFIVTIIILVMSIVLHELSHGYMAEILGDPTPRLQGRLTINPLKHLDPFGSIIVPIITSIAGFTFGWAKPIEWNPYNIKNRRIGEFLISIAGPGSNILISIIFGLIIRFNYDSLSQSFLIVSSYIVIINIALAVFNLVPIPPLDGSKILFSLIPPHLSHIRTVFERYSIILVVLFIVVIWRFIEPIIPFLFKIITGVGL